MNEGIQKKLENIGKYGCYFLCLLKAAKWDENEIIKAYDEALKKGYNIIVYLYIVIIMR